MVALSRIRTCHGFHFNAGASCAVCFRPNVHAVALVIQTQRHVYPAVCACERPNHQKHIEAAHLRLMEWHRGMSCAVNLAAWMPASCAVTSTSPCHTTCT